MDLTYLVNIRLVRHSVSFCGFFLVNCIFKKFAHFIKNFTFVGVEFTMFFYCISTPIKLL